MNTNSSSEFSSNTLSTCRLWLITHVGQVP
jgi:hypothetical protein